MTGVVAIGVPAAFSIWRLSAASWPHGDGRKWAAGVARRAVGPGLVLSSSAALQLSAAIAVSLFQAVGALATSGLRFLCAAVVLLAVVRPTLHGRSCATWGAVLAFGAVMAGMNVVFYLAAERVPLGTVVTIEFLGPLLVAALGAHRIRELLWVVVAAVGVLLVAGPVWGVSADGLILSGLGAVGLAGYVSLSQAVGRNTSRLDGLALSVGVAAILTLPLSVPALPHLTDEQIGTVVLTAVLGIVLAFALEMQAIRWSSAKTVSVLLSLDPAFAALAGLVLLGQNLALLPVIGIVCVIVAGVGVSVDSPDLRSSGPAGRTPGG